MTSFPSALLLFHPFQEPGGLEALRGLQPGALDHAHDDARGMNVHGQLDLLVLRLQ